MAAVLYAPEKELKWYTNEQVQWPVCEAHIALYLRYIRTRHYSSRRHRRWDGGSYGFRLRSVFYLFFCL